MPTTEELILRVKYDIEKGGIQFAADSLKKYAAAANEGGKAVKDLENKVNSASLAFARKQKALNNARDAIVKTQFAFAGLSQAAGGSVGAILNLTNQIEDFEFAAKKSGQSVNVFSSTISQATSSVGAFGVAALAAGAAVVGWKIGRWIADVTGLDNAIKKATDSMLGFGSAADSADAALAKALNRVAQAGITNKKLNEDITKANLDSQKQIIEAGMTTAQKLAAIQGDMYAIMTRDQSKFTADENRSMIKRYDDLARLATQYTVQLNEENKRQVEDAKHKAEEMKKAEEEIMIGQFKAMQEIERGNEEARAHDLENQRQYVEAQKQAEFELQLFRAKSAQDGRDFMVTNSLQLLRQLGIEPNQAAFNAMQNAFNEAVKKISGGAKLSKAQLQTILPTLIQLAQASLDYGLKLSPATIELLKQAGLWDDITNKPKATKTQTDGIADLVSALTKEPNGLIPTLQKFIDMLAQLNGMTVNTTVNTNYTTDGEPPGLGHKDPNTLRSRAGLRGMEVVDKAQQLYLLHGGEGVLGKDVMQQLKNGQGMTGGTVNIGPGAFVINGTNLNAAQLEQVIINSLRKAGALAGWKR